MKTKCIVIILVSMLLPAAMIFQSCNKEEKEESNQPPTCEITSPANGQQIIKGETITISVEADDSDGSISEVRFFIDGVGKGSANSFPFNYNWNTNSESLGNHTLKATSFDNTGGKASNEITLELIQGGSTGTFTDPRDGHSYNTVDIGDQTWFAENLNYETTNSWWYGNSSANGDIYGRLYTWEAALTACPSGWHLPSDEEWKTMEMALGMSQSEADGGDWRGTDQGEQMKSTSGWDENGNGTNSSGFNALPGGYRLSSGSFRYLGRSGYWWSSSEYSGTSAWRRGLNDDRGQVHRYYDYGRTYGFSVRCLKD